MKKVLYPLTLFFLFLFIPNVEAGFFDWLKNTFYFEASSLNISNSSNTASILISGNPSCVNSDEIGGIIFQDYNADGTNDAEEPFLYGVDVSIFDDNGQVGVTIQTDANGEYLFSSLTISQTYRVEITSPMGMEEGPIGTDSKSSVQMVVAGTCNADLGLLDPSDYCDDDPFVIIPCYAELAYDGAYKEESALAKLLYSEDGHHFTGMTPLPTFAATKLANHEDIGAVYGTAWQRTKERLYLGALHKRYVDFGPNGPDAIYQYDASGTMTGVIELDALLSATNTAGTDVHDFTPVGGEVYDLGTGNASFDGAGKIAFGDLEISADNKTLYVVNLFDRKIYALDVFTGLVGDVSISNSWDAPDATGATRHRPYGLAWHHGKLWIGSVDENGTNAYVHSLDPAGTTFNLELTVDLTYTRQPITGHDANLNPGDWNAWEGDPETMSYDNHNLEIFYPQPILSDIEFDGENMILGFRDRFGDQVGGNKRFKTSATEDTWGNSGGDILKVCYINGSYVLETGNGGACAGVGGLDNSGPSGYEFYHWDVYDFTDPVDPNTAIDGSFHWETTQGGLLQLDGKPSILTTAMDPFNDFSGGLIKLDNAEGGREGVGNGSSNAGDLTGGYTLYESGDYSGGNPPVSGTSAKANGLGDLEAFCSAAPLEIGNLVWLDTDIDGIQDPSESGLIGVTVTLTDASDVSLGTVVTDANGRYNFTNADITGDLEYFTDYKVKINLTDAQKSNATISNLAPVNSGNGKNDNDASLMASTAEVVITTGGPGETNHSVDFGFVTGGAVGNRVWLDENSDGIMDAGEPGIPGVVVELNDGICTSGSTCPTTITDADGGYIFNNIIPGNYTVKVLSNVPTGLNSIFDEDSGTTSPNMETAVIVTPGGEYVTADFGYNYVTKVNTDTPAMTDTGALGNRIWNDANSNGIQDPGESGIANVTVTLMSDPDQDGIYTATSTTTTDAYGNYIFDDIAPGAYVVEVTEADITSAGFTSTPTGDPDGDANNISDPIVIAPGDVWLGGNFGYPSSGTPADIGSTVFVDVDGSGDYNIGTDIPMAGVSVALILDTDNGMDWDIGEKVIATTVTAADGTYLFPDLPAGNYVVVITDVNNVMNQLNISVDPQGSVDGVSGVTLGATDNLVQNFGYVPADHDATTGFIGDLIFLDADGSAGFTPGDTGLEGVEVQLLNGDDDSILLTTITDENGRYFFGALPAANYKVKVNTTSLPAGLTSSSDPDGGVPAANESASFALASGANNLTQDFGYKAITARTIAGTIWKDSDADGELVLDPTETERFADVTVELLDANNNIVSTTTTLADGTYTFTGIPSGTYTVNVADQNKELIHYWHSPTSGSDNEANMVSVDATTANVTDVDFGYYDKGASLGNLVWMDTNQNNAQDIDERGLPGAKVTLSIDYDGGGTDLTVTTITNQDGEYSFKGLLLDEDYNGDGMGTEPTYVMTVTLPDPDMDGLYIATTNDLAGGDDMKDSDLHTGQSVMPVQGRINVANETDPVTETTAASIDFGYHLDCASPVMEYAITADGSDLAAMQTTDYFKSAGTGMMEHTKETQKNGSIQSWTYCEIAGWRYYYHPQDPDEYLFAVEMGANTTEIDYIEIRVDDNATDRYATGTEDAMFVMMRDWSIKTVGDAALTAPINVRFYFPPNEFKQMYDAAVAQAVTWGVGVPNVADADWFMTNDFNPDTQVNEDGTTLMSSTGFSNITTSEAVSTTATGTNTTLSTPEENNINHIQFNGLNSVQGGTAFIQINRTALPVELVAFTGRVLGCNTVLVWRSDSEQGFSHYELEWSGNGQNYQRIKALNGTGGTIAQRYEYTDKAASHNNYYRLKMIDEDGSFEYSKTVYLGTDCDNGNNLTIYPNPIIKNGGSINVKFFAKRDAEQIALIDMAGRVLRVLNVSTELEWNTLLININNLPSGNYHIKQLGSRNGKVLVIQE